VAERAAPVLIRYKRLTPGSGGDGTHRGGLGQEALVELRGAAADTGRRQRVTRRCGSGIGPRIT
jgi:N-methylhydantoinase B/oxoprolinase/acetone carboxylase alpha subunit